MPSLKIPSSGLLLQPRNEDFKPGTGLPEAFSLTLADNVIEDMIKCVNDGKSISLSLGRNPVLMFGSKVQHLMVSDDELPHGATEIYRTELDRNANSEDEEAPCTFVTRANKQRFIPITKPITKKAGAKAASAAAAAQAVDPAIEAPIKKRAGAKAASAAAAAQAVDPAIAGAKAASDAAAAQAVDPTLEALKAGMSEELSKKPSSAMIKEPPTTGRKRATKPATNTSRFFSQNKKALAGEAIRSSPTSPALSGVGSPSLGPTSVPLSQQKAEKDKEVRSWIVHYLAINNATEEDVWEFFSRKTNHTREDFKTALEKNADYNSSSKTWSLRQKAFKELDPWPFDYDSQEDRKKAIDNAITALDKMRLHVSDPLWQKLLPESERGQGIVVSRLAAKIAQKGSAQGRTPLHDKNTETDDDKLAGESLSVKKVGGEPMSRTSSSGPAAKNKKISEKEAQAKRLLGKGGKAKTTGKASPAAKTSPAKKPVAKKEDTSRIKSSQYVNDSDEEDDPPLPDSTKKVAASTPKPIAAVPVAIRPPVKRARADDGPDIRAPAIKKARKDEGASTPLLNGHPPSHRPSDASHFSQNSTNSNSSRSTVSSAIKTKTSSPQKSSPLASSPPTNASDIDEEDPYHTSSSASPYTASINPLKRKAADNNTRVAKKTVNGANGVRQSQKPASASSASPASSSGNPDGRVVSDEVLDMADRFKDLYGTYSRLHRRLEGTPNPSQKEIDNLTSMHTKLQDLKERIFESVNS